MKTVALCALTMLGSVLACHASESRFVVKDEGFSVRQLPGWNSTRERGAIVFQRASAQGQTDTTIVLRAVAIDNIRPEARKESGLSRALASTLANLPNSTVSSVKPSGHSELGGVRYHVTFDPPGIDQHMERTQVALIGERHLFHLMHTAPQGALKGTAAFFDEVVASLREE